MYTFLFQNGDLVIDKNRGTFIPIEGTQKTSQDVAWFLLTEEDPERSTGCNLIVPEKIFAGNSTSTTVAKSIVVREIDQAINRLIECQEQELAYIPPAERVLGISQINVGSIDKTSFSFFVAVATADADLVPASFRVLLGQQFAPTADKHIFPNVVTDDVR